MRLILVLCISLLSTAKTEAQGFSTVNLCGGINTVAFTNGIRTSEDSALFSLNRLIEKVAQKASSEDDENLYWDSSRKHLFYNHSYGAIVDVLEVYVQKRDERTDLFWDWFYDLTDAPEWFREITGEAQMAERNLLPLADNMKSIEASFRALLGEEDGVVSVSHSQGNFFTNAAFRTLLSEKNYSERLSHISVATPASYVAGSGPYFTLRSDGVINVLMRLASVQLQLPLPLSPNASNSNPRPGVFDHGFVEHYLDGDGSGDQIIEEVIDALKKLPQPKENYKNRVSADCWEWWDEIKVDLSQDDPSLCYLGCAGAEVDMGTFTCNSHCKYFCKCGFQ